MIEEPSWRYIEQSDVWREHIQPWLDEMYLDSLEDLRTKGSEDSFHYWRGYATAIQAIKSMPANMVELERQEAAQESKDDGRSKPGPKQWVRNIRLGSFGRRDNQA